MASTKSHLVGYFLFFILFLAVLNHQKISVDTNSLVVIFGAGLIGTVLPDVDAGNSRIRKYANLASGLGLILFVALYLRDRNDIYLYGLAGIGIFLLFLAVIKHRGILHNFLAGLAISAGLWHFFGEFVAAGFFIGFFTHIFWDKFPKIKI